MDNKHEHVRPRKVAMSDQAEAKGVPLHVKHAEKAEVIDQAIHRSRYHWCHGWHWRGYQLEGWWRSVQRSKQHSEDWQCLIAANCGPCTG